MYFEDLMDFSNERIYFLMGLARPKNNRDITKAQRVFFRIPVRSMDSYHYNLRKLEADCERTGLNMYMYVSVNARDTVKSYENFKKKLVEYENQAMHGKEDFRKPLMNLDKTWYSACMKQNARGTKYYLLDIDTKDPATRLKIANAILPLVKTVLIEKETRNGYHWIVKPFDVRVIKDIPNVSIQTDGLLYLGCTGFKEL
jgi:hypothetical protein